MIIDAHVHLFPPDIVAARDAYLTRDEWFRDLYQNPKARMATADELLRSMDASGIEQSVVASFPWADQELCEHHNAYYRTLTNDRLMFLCTVQPRAGRRATEELERCLDAGFVGMGEMNVDAQGVELGHEELLGPLVERLVAANGTLMVHSSEPVGHAYPGKGGNTPDKLYQFAVRHPELKLVGAHWGGGMPFYYLMPELGPALPNLYFDSAATDFLYDRRVFGAVTDIAGTDRALFGSDFPLLSHERVLAHVRSAGLPSATEEAVLGANAAKVYCR